MKTSVSDSEEGKAVIDENGDKVGIVSEVRHGTAYVDPDPGLTEKLKTKLGWEDKDEEDFPLQEASIEEITDDEIRLTHL
jgi:hypothetical protein